MNNMASIARLGILSHQRAAAVPHTSIADEDVQSRRRSRRVPNGRAIHEYANVYFDARNPMMRKRYKYRRELVVIRINPTVLDAPGAVIADGNAAAGITRFSVSPQGLQMLDETRVYAEWWTDPDIATEKEKKRQRCAEVLIPDRIPPTFLTGCYVHDRQALQLCQQQAPGLKAVVNPRVFFD
ncbi:DUF4433 domain-containing protein [Nonomuraea fuscirosea]